MDRSPAALPVRLSGAVFKKWACHARTIASVQAALDTTQPCR